MTRSNIIDRRALFTALRTGDPDLEAATAKIQETVEEWDVSAMNRKFDLVCSGDSCASIAIPVRTQPVSDAP